MSQRQTVASGDSHCVCLQFKKHKADDVTGRAFANDSGDITMATLHGSVFQLARAMPTQIWLAQRFHFQVQFLL